MAESGEWDVERRVVIEALKNAERYKKQPLLTKPEIQRAIENTIKQIELNMEYFQTKYPSPAAKAGCYDIIDNIEWTNGFWTGMLWLAYEYTNNKKFSELANIHVDSFLNRVEQRIELDHHDLGFLYSLSCVSGYQLTGSEAAKKAALMAAEKLIERFQPCGGFIQAWGEMGKKENYRLIIDCMLNIPLLYWASKITGDNKYAAIAEQHFDTSCRYVIRDEASAFHTFYFNPEDGSPDRGVTRQGYNDDSAWARGQAWGIYGIPLNYRHVHNAASIDLYKGMLHYFLNRLPQDFVCYWDLIFNDGSGQSRDSSAAAIAVCGMHEMDKYLSDKADREIYRYSMHAILRALIERYTLTAKAGSPVLAHGVYSWHSGKGVDEGNIWGDYFYFEALMRLYKEWELYW